jgi:hypothetical protein
MSAIKKHAVFNLIVIGATVAFYLSLMFFVGPARARGAFGLFGLLGFGVLFYKKRGRQRVDAEPPYDERDWDIERRAHTIAFAVFWLVFVGVCVGAAFICGDAATIPVKILPMVVFVAWGIWQGAQSAAVLIQYRLQS